MELDEAGNRHLEPWSKASKKPLASDALPLPVGLTNKIFFVLFFSASYFLMRRWREKVRTSMPLHILTLGEIFAIVAQISSFIYLLGFFGIDYVQYFIGKDFVEDDRQGFVTAGARTIKAVLLKGKSLEEHSDEDIVCAISSGEVPCHSLEAFLKDCKRATSLRRRAIEQITGRSLTGLPLEGFDYSSILGQCCEMPIGYVQVPVGVAGPLLLDGIEYMLPLATTEGTLIESANRGCKAIRLSGGANSIILRDGMSRAPVVRFGSAQRAAEFKFYVEHPDNFELLCHAFKSTSKYCRLQSVQCAMAGRNLYMRFVCSTGDAMGMNMVTKGAERVLKDLKAPFPDMDVLSVSGNYCADKKATAINWIQGRCKSVICESVIKGEVVSQVFKTTVPALVELNMLKNLAGSAIAGGLGGFNAHVSNIVTAIFIATGQDPAQNVESSQCITLLEEANGGSDLHVSVTMPCIEVGTTGGGTKLASQGACLNLLGVKGPNETFPGLNAQSLARIVAGAVLAGELSLLATQAKGELVKSHMKYNRSNRDICGGMLSTSVEKDQ